MKENRELEKYYMIWREIRQYLMAREYERIGGPKQFEVSSFRWKDQDPEAQKHSHSDYGRFTPQL